MRKLGFREDKLPACDRRASKKQLDIAIILNALLYFDYFLH